MENQWETNSRSIHQDTMDLYRACGNTAMDTLFWCLLYINSSLCRAANRQAIKEALLEQSKAYETLLGSFYPNPVGQDLIRRLDLQNRYFLVFVERGLSKNQSGQEQAHRQWMENGRQIARLFARLNPYWKEPEWSAMIGQWIHMLSRILRQSAAGDTDAFPQLAPLTRRLALDMSDYMAKGLVEKHYV